MPSPAPLVHDLSHPPAGPSLQWPIEVIVPSVAGMIGWIVLFLPAVTAVLGMGIGLAFWREQPRGTRTLPLVALGAIALGAAFYLFFLGWIVWSGRVLVLVADPFERDGALYSATLVGLAASFVVIWLALLHERLKRGAEDAQGLAAANRKLRHRSEELEEFSYAVSHDLKSPLIAIDWLVDELRAAGDDAEVREQLVQRVGRHVEQMNALVEDLLLLAQMEHEGRTEQPCGVEAAIEEVHDALAPMAHRRRIAIDVVTPASAGVFLPPVRLKQVLQNLVENAIQHGAEGGTVRIACADEGPGLVRLSVSDDGPGIPESERERVFQAFVRGSATGAARPGSGIGLTLVRKIARAYGGRAWVEGAPEEGARFCVQLPGATVGQGDDGQGVRTQMRAAVRDDHLEHHHHG